jgi:Protein of unknown function (DUF2844)
MFKQLMCSSALRETVRRILSINSLAALSLAVLVCVAPASASLGGDAASVQADQIRLQGSLQETAGQGYTVEEIKSASGTLVREYFSPQGRVFGIVWQGQWPPDMRQLLGSYFDQYKQAASAQSASRVGRKPLTIRQPGLVVQISGHPRSFSGRAYSPDQLPASVTAEAIR